MNLGKPRRRLHVARRPTVEFDMPVDDGSEDHPTESGPLRAEPPATNTRRVSAERADPAARAADRGDRSHRTG
jgi:hypothetical protein